MRKLILVWVAAVLTLASLAGPAAAATTVSIISDGLRVDVTFTGKQPAKARLVVGGDSYKLKRSGTTWRTKELSAARVAALTGKRAKVKATIKGKRKTLKSTVAGPATTPTPPTTTPGSGPAPLFTAPGVDSTGTTAWEAVKGYFANSTLTDCPAGWPNCSVEQRYGIFADGTHWYCRLTPNSGSDIRSVGSIQQILGAEQKADGAWAVSFSLSSYGNTTVYTARVAADGSAAVQYWGPGVSTSGPPSDVTTGLIWMRGAKDCSY